MSPAWSPILAAYSDEASRTSKIENGMQIRIDSRTSCDVYPCFCDVHLSIHDLDSDRFELELRHPPLTEEVREVVLAHHGEVHEHRLMTAVRIPLAINTARPIVLQLAAAIRAVTGRGANYVDRNWKWICPRTAASLDQFARVLNRAGRLRPPTAAHRTIERTTE
jgi:hypothetical protein